MEHQSPHNIILTTSSKNSDVVRKRNMALYLKEAHGTSVSGSIASCIHSGVVRKKNMALYLKEAHGTPLNSPDQQHFA